ncbi:hypothetical protein V8C34DRAFT_268259, partial [Trichoderma compactum]
MSSGLLHVALTCSCAARTLGNQSKDGINGPTRFFTSCPNFFILVLNLDTSFVPVRSHSMWKLPMFCSFFLPFFSFSLLFF